MGGFVSSFSLYGFSGKEVSDWRRQVNEKREKIFRKHWKNRRHIPNLISLDDARDFEFVVEWYDESGELMDRSQERRRLDKLIALGVDVNLPREEQPVV